MTLQQQHEEEEEEEPSAATAKRRRQAAIERFRSTFSAWDFLHFPWVLVPNGSFCGFFDWLPAQVRIGPWNPVAIAYMAALYYLLLLTGAYLSVFRNDTDTGTDSYTASISNTNSTTLADNDDLYKNEDYSYPPVFSGPWCYQLTAFAYMLYIMYLIVQGPNGMHAWSTYTVQSWTLLTVRHGLCVLAPFSTRAHQLADVIRFPAACSATITYVVWNFVLLPFLYCVVLKDNAQHQSNLLQFATSFRLLNIHVLNIALAVLNAGPWANPPCDLQLLSTDFYGAIFSVMMYMTYYLGILDRLGIHLYPIFSPRLGTAAVLLFWSLLWGSYVVTFYAWQWYLR